MIFLSFCMLDDFIAEILMLLTSYLFSLVVSDLHLETKGFRFDSGC